MGMAVEPRLIENRDTWLAWRRENLNASEIAACFGLHPYKTLAQLAAAKRGIDVGPDPDSAVIRRGQAFEDDAASEVGNLRPDWDIVKCVRYYGDTEHRLGATPDFFCVDPARPGHGVLQIKTVARPVFRDEWTDETPPYHVILQVTTEMLLTDAAWGAIGALVIGDYS